MCLICSTPLTPQEKRRNLQEIADLLPIAHLLDIMKEIEKEEQDEKNKVASK